MQAIKFRTRGELRRDSVDPEDLTLDSLREIFAELYKVSADGYEFTYLDDDEDWVELSSEREMTEAIRLMQGKTLHVRAQRDQDRDVRMSPRQPYKPHRTHLAEYHNREQTVADQADAEQREVVEERKTQEGFRHPAICDKCRRDIVGIRHKCRVCPDYDLCEECFEDASDEHPGHAFFAMERTHVEEVEPVVEPVKPAVEVPAVEEPKPIVEETVVEEFEPAVEEPVVEEPKAAAEELVVEESKAAAEEPIVEESKAAEELVVEESKPAAEEPIVEDRKPAAEEPVVEEFLVEERVEERVEEPTAEANRFMTSLRYLNEMGFDNNEDNIRALVYHRGDVALALSQLLG